MVRAGDELEVEWGGWSGRALRPMRVGMARRVCWAGGVLYTMSGVASLPLAAGWLEVDGADRAGVVPGCLLGLLGGAVISAFGHAPPEALTRWLPRVLLAGLVAPLVVVGLALVALGPHLGVGAIYYVEAPLIAWVCLRRSWAVGVTAGMVASYVLALLSIDGARAPGMQLVIVVSAVIATSVVVGDLAHRYDDAERAERAARLELADLNLHLEQRVADQVDELERVGQLRRFLAPQVADVVVAGGDALLEPHRRDVAVLFCDLRGFTRFTNAVAAETVVAVLGEYYAVVGRVLEAHGATIGGYDGDGVMAYLGDPIPRPDAPEAAVAMARELGGAMDRLIASWRDAGHDLGFGVGLAHGEATLGVVGFDGRFDYTPLGAVVNLAARLCSEAGPGEIVVDRSMVDVAGRARHRGDVALKGYADPVPTYALTR